MKRFNCKHFPVEMEEALNGYWIKHEDHERAVLDYNKSASRMWDSENNTQQRITEECNDKLEAQHRKIIYLSTACFIMAAILLFKVLG
jgi:hypothetical protein